MIFISPIMAFSTLKVDSHIEENQCCVTSNAIEEKKIIAVVRNYLLKMKTMDVQTRIAIPILVNSLRFLLFMYLFQNPIL